MKSLPNAISLSRILLSIFLFFTEPLSANFYIIYIICGLSDVTDGYIARKTGTLSRLGEKLDTLADMIMAVTLLIILYPVIKPESEMMYWIIVIAAVRVASILAAFVRYKELSGLHTYGNKITGIVLFIFPVLLSFINARVLIYSGCIIASISALEEFIIQMISKELKPNIRGLFDEIGYIRREK
ncbi:CDP-diacylglycerol--glycerol-3-phosphate 3-phosphatidyltransferase [Ruminiclostridium sufflavum DSM 19573]|uniref:Phosphatidylglycerophosphate synthase n=1 Tax=Ruminiclostridium sufflavum DSM 19573 TaxID=1121337 RepID=A0A318XS12_9FIRM|nr:CDP-alcohol phosphatidyltransferase family protein [Ruminiclostridium sufflavum]PYG89031.1 CDP-diacylglycerol--glycerol-3-phosphate 3-phosphatidyltransferase [Ruminiclostridium sufflavum DSM 19573]